jgi:hypothetical protein
MRLAARSCQKAGVSDRPVVGKGFYCGEIIFLGGFGNGEIIFISAVKSFASETRNVWPSIP